MTAARVVVVLVFSVVDLLDGLLAVAAAAPVPSPKEEENVVEKDGVRFEVVVPQRTWAIPDDKPAGAAPVKLALRITNRTKSPLGVLVRRELVGRVFGVPGPEDAGSACFLAESVDRNQAVRGWVDAEMRPDAWTGAHGHGSAIRLRERLEVQLTPRAGW